MVCTGYEWDPKKAKLNIRKHGVAFAEAVSVFFDDSAMTVEDNNPDEVQFATMGMDVFGCVLVVVYTWREDNIRLISARKATAKERKQYGGWPMKKEYDFRGGKREAIDPIPPGKTRITIRIDDDVLDWFRKEVNARGGGNYQTMMNNALKEHIKQRKEPLEAIVRRVVREELKKTG